jgi:hypothetical protein
MELDNNSSKVDDTMMCLICYDTDDISQDTFGKKHWSCTHTEFHNSCSKEWLRRKPICPLCRCDTLWKPPSIKIIDYDNESNVQLSLHNNNERIITQDDYTYKFIVSNTNNFSVTLQKYIFDWKYNLCDKQYNNHVITIVKPFGVTGFCSCGNATSFDWKG